MLNKIGQQRSFLQEVESLGGTVRLADVGQQVLPDGQQIVLPPVLLGQIGDDPSKKTVCMYGHLDVQPAFKVGRIEIRI